MSRWSHYEQAELFDVELAEGYLTRPAQTSHELEMGRQLAAAIDLIVRLRRRQTELAQRLHVKELKLEDVGALPAFVEALCQHQNWVHPMERCPDCGAEAYI